MKDYIRFSHLGSWTKCQLSNVNIWALAIIQNNFIVSSRLYFEKWHQHFFHSVEEEWEIWWDWWNWKSGPLRDQIWCQCLVLRSLALLLPAWSHLLLESSVTLWEWSGPREQTTLPRAKGMLPNTHTYTHRNYFIHSNAHASKLVGSLSQNDQVNNVKYTKYKWPCVDCTLTPMIRLEPVNFTTYIGVFLDLAALIKPVRPPRFLKRCITSYLKTAPN